MARIRLTNAKPMSLPGFEKQRKIHRQQARKLPDGRSGTYSYRFQTYHDSTRVYSKPSILKFDSYQDAYEYVLLNTPAGYQGLLDGVSILAK